MVLIHRVVSNNIPQRCVCVNDNGAAGDLAESEKGGEECEKNKFLFSKMEKTLKCRNQQSCQAKADNLSNKYTPLINTMCVSHTYTKTHANTHTEETLLL